MNARFRSISLALVLAGALGAGAAHAEGVKLGAILEHSGAGSTMGLPLIEGLRLAVDDLNALGGLEVRGGRQKVELKLYDDRSVAAEAVSLGKRLVEQDGARIVIGPVLSSAALPLAEVTQPSGVVQVHVGATALVKLLGKPGHELLVKASPYEGGARGTAAHYIPRVVEALGLKSVVVLLPNTESGKDYERWARQAFEAAGVKILSTEMFPAQTKDFYPVLTKVLAAKPDALYFGYTNWEAAPIIRQARELGHQGPLVAAGAGITAAAAVDSAGKLVDGFTWITYFPPPTDPRMREFAQRLKARAPRVSEEDQGWALYMYETVMLVADAIKRAGTPDDAKKICQALRGATRRGIVTIEIDATGLAHTDYHMGRVEGGKVTYTHIPLKTASRSN